MRVALLLLVLFAAVFTAWLHVGHQVIGEVDIAYLSLSNRDSDALERLDLREPSNATPALGFMAPATGAGE